MYSKTLKLYPFHNSLTQSIHRTISLSYSTALRLVQLKAMLIESQKNSRLSSILIPLSLLSINTI